MKVSFGNAGTASAAPAPQAATAAAPQSQPAAAPAQPVEVVAAVPTGAVPANPAPAAAPQPVAPVAAAPAANTGPVVTNEGNAVAKVPDPGEVANRPAFADDDDIPAQDIVLPRVNIVQKVGDLSNIYKPGTLLLDGSLTIAEAPTDPAKASTAVRMLFVGFRKKQWVERVDGGGRGNMFATEQEVAAAGGSTNYDIAKARKIPWYQPMATALVLIEQPAGIDATLFPHTFEGKNYALALWTLKGGSFTNCAKIVYSARKMGRLRLTGYRGGFWTIATKLSRANTGNTSFIPVTLAAEATTEQFRAWLTELVGF